MNRNLTLIISILVVVILLVVWVYMLFFSGSADENQETIDGSGTFTEFDEFGNDVTNDNFNNDGSNFDGVDDTDNNDESYDPDILRQLTTRNVIGYTEVEMASTTYIMYMESGVGHIYRIDLNTGVEERVSATTIPDAREASFSSAGQFVAVKTGDNVGINPISIAKIDYEEKSLSIEPVSDNVSQFVFVENNKLLYTIPSNNSVVVNSYDLQNDSISVIFSTLFREATVSFGTNMIGPHYYLPKTSNLLEGFVYKVQSGTEERLEIDGYGLVINSNGHNVLATYKEENRLNTTLKDSSGESRDISIPLIPEKCVWADAELHCAIPNGSNLLYNSIDRWNQGLVSFSDNLWLVGETTERLIDITAHSGRKVDVINGKIGQLSKDWYFQNKTDSSLWVYELSTMSQNNNDNL